MKEFFNFESKLPIRMAPKLTAKHFDLPGFTQLRVNLAAQLLSHSVAAGISALVAIGRLEPEAQNTADFVERFDSLFNCFNSSRLSSGHKYRYAIRESSSHFAFLKECLIWLDSVIPITECKLPCLNGWKMAINCLFQLFDHLKSQYNIKSHKIHRFNRFEDKLISNCTMYAMMYVNMYVL